MYFKVYILGVEYQIIGNYLLTNELDERVWSEYNTDTKIIQVCTSQDPQYIRAEIAKCIAEIYIYEADAQNLPKLTPKQALSHARSSLREAKREFIKHAS
jgi:hypothetical protein